MADNSVKVTVEDGVSAEIPKKIERIAASARVAHTAVEKLKSELNSINAGGLDRLNNAVNGSASSISRLTSAQQQNTNAAQQAVIAQQRLATETARTSTQQQRLSTESAKTATQQQRLATESAKTATQHQKLAGETAKASTQQQRLATEAAKTATQQQRLSTETARTMTAQNNAAASAIRLQQAQDRLNQANNKGVQGAKSHADSILLLGRNFLTLAAAATAAKVALDLATNYTVVNNKIKTVTESIGQQEALYKRLYATALETSTGIDVVTQAFIRYDRPMKQMGKSQEDTIRLITTVNKELANTGATTAEAASAVLQLGQAFGSGKLQGEEFRAISETMPTLLDAVAAATGKNISQVKQLGSEGKITSAVLLQALTEMQEKTDATYAKTAQTVPQALTNIKTALTDVIGKMDEYLGVSSSLAAGLNFLAHNMDTLGFAASVLGAGLLVAFGPTLLAALTAATGGVVAFTVAIAANPIGLLVVGITAAVAALTFFGDEIKVTEDGLVNLQDVAAAVWFYIKEGVSGVTEFMSSTWATATALMNAATGAMGEFFGMTGATIMTLARTYINFVIGAWVGAVNTIRTMWADLPTAFELIFNSIINLAASAAESVVNSWQIGLRSIASAASNMAPEMAAGLNGALDAVTIKIPRAKLSAAGVKMGNDIKGGISSAMGRDYVGEIATGVMGKAREIAKARQSADTPLRGAGKNTIEAEAEKGKKAKAPKAPKAPKTPKEKLTDEQKAYNKALDEILKPQREFDAALKVANDLLSNGAITREKYNALVAKATDEFKRATDPMYSFNKSAAEQFEVLNKVGIAAEAEAQVMQVRNQALQAGLPFNEQMAQSIRDTVDALDMAQLRQGALNSIYDETIGKQRSIIAQQNAYNAALAAGSLTAEQHSIKMANLNVQQAQLNMLMGSFAYNDALVAGLGQFVANYQGVMMGLSDAWGNFFTSFSEGFANSIGQAIVYGDDLGESLKNVAQQALSELISSLIKLGLQYVVNAALAKAAVTSTTAAGAAGAAATQAAWAPPAAMVSLATFGANAIPANIGIASTVAITKSLGALTGFMTGGYTGNVATDEIAGLVHGKEFVVNATATRKYRPVLEAMNSGGSSVAAVAQNADNAGNSGGNTYIKFDIVNQIEVQGGEGDTNAEALEKAATAISQKTQGDIAQSIRSGGVWKNLIRSTAG